MQDLKTLQADKQFLAEHLLPEHSRNFKGKYSVRFEAATAEVENAGEKLKKAFLNVFGDWVNYCKLTPLPKTRKNDTEKVQLNGRIEMDGKPILDELDTLYSQRGPSRWHPTKDGSGPGR